MTEPVLGWRLWRLREGQLASWGVDYRWDPGDNHARCIVRGRSACRVSPGQYCQCGIWAVWSPRECRDRAGMEAGVDGSEHVMGLISGWGTIAVHGREGFRAEWAAVRCLFTNRPGTLATRTLGSRLFSWWRRDRARSDESRQASDYETIEPYRWDVLHGVADRYGVPLVSLGMAIRTGFLGEMGVPHRQIAEACSLIGLPSGY